MGEYTVVMPGHGILGETFPERVILVHRATADVFADGQAQELVPRQVSVVPGSQLP